MSGMLADAVSNAMDLRGVVLLGSKHCGDVATVDGYVTDLTIDLMP